MSWRTEALAKRLKAIPDGRVSDTARKAGITLRHLMRLRKGDSASVGLSTLEGLADALGESIGSILGERADHPVKAVAAPPSVDPRGVRRLIRKLRDVATEAEKIESQLGEE